MHLKNDKKCTIHTEWGGYIHLLGRWGAYINELCVTLKRQNAWAKSTDLTGDKTKK